ncbi:DegV family protein [uncultured Clostridium sp.]|uniref:DegV family protein n=1 Tax=uncultured Clostridium sp. TaxID=59620 RepID=UPI00261B26F4|nr:DegV family protein [uncultured Clostridium sp.]
MQKIAILTDSSCDLSREEREQKGIFMLPVKIIYKDGEYLDHLTISPQEIYDRIEEEVPTTSLPSADYMHEVFDKIEAEGYTHVVGIFLSSALSGTFNAIRLQIQERESFTYNMFDSGILGYPLGMIVLKAYKMVQEGKSFEEIVEYLPVIKKNTFGYYTLNTLTYLKRGGRIGKVAGTVGEFLNLKPIITVDEDGSYVTVAKARGRKQSLKKLKAIADDFIAEGNCKLYILHGNALAEATALKETFVGHPSITDIDIRDIGPAMGIHVGPGMIAFALQKEC